MKRKGKSGFLKSAVLEYQAANPNVTITYEFAGNEAPKNSQEMDTLYKRVNTEIVSSQAADVYVFDKLPWEGYAQQGLLLDIDETVETLLDIPMLVLIVRRPVQSLEYQ